MLFKYKNNSYINLGDGSHNRIVWSCSNTVKTHNVNIFHKILATSFPVAKTFIEYNSNNSEKNEEESTDIEFTKQKAGTEMMKMLLTLNDQMYMKKTRKILLWLTSLRACKSKLMRIFFQKLNWIIVWWLRYRT